MIQVTTIMCNVTSFLPDARGPVLAQETVPTAAASSDVSGLLVVPEHAGHVQCHQCS